jgi:hypothetical protein
LLQLLSEIFGEIAELFNRELFQYAAGEIVEEDVELRIGQHHSRPEELDECPEICTIAL